MLNAEDGTKNWLWNDVVFFTSAALNLGFSFIEHRFYSSLVSQQRPFIYLSITGIGVKTLNDGGCNTHTGDDDYSQLHRFPKHRASERVEPSTKIDEDEKKKNISLKRAKVGVLNLLTWFVTVSFLISLTHHRSTVEAEKLGTGDRKVCFFWCTNGTHYIHFFLSFFSPLTLSLPHSMCYTKNKTRVK